MNWKDIPGFEGLYKINENGEVKSLPRIVNCGRGAGLRTIPEKLIAPYKDKTGNRKIQLFSKNKKQTKSIEKLLKELF